MKRDKPVSNLLTFTDKGKYQLKLTGGENEYQLNEYNLNVLNSNSWLSIK